MTEETQRLTGEAGERERVRASEVSWALRAVTTAAGAVDHELAGRLGLRPLDYTALGHVMDSSRELGPAELSGLVGVSTGSGTELVDRLERAGHLERHPHPGDRRRVVLRVSARAADRVVGELTELFDDLDELADGLTEQEQAVVVRYLREAAARMQRYAGRGAAVSPPSDDRPRVHAETREQWRAWLTQNQGAVAGVWLVSWRKRTGRPAMSYDEAVTEALAVGWVDSRPNALDDDRTMLYFSPRRVGSGWSRPNKIRVAALEAAGLMQPAGAAAVERARSDGSWTMLDDVEDLVVPEDLAAAFDAVPGSRERWDAFPRSARRGILEWVLQAKRPETRARRTAETAELAGRGERAAQWRRPGTRGSGA